MQTGKTILVVDDEPQIRSLFSSLLTGEGFKVCEASCAGNAYTLLLREPIDLVLLDICIPEIDGKAISRYLKLFHGNVKVIITSIYPVDAQQRMIGTADGYYEKSHEIDELLETINQVLQNLA